ncbi:hypothetical protein FBUS_02943 [Fasciolopsis buskii]|uniref:Uncharacterized protein n=1 Tax=Fasciolopsis buskii TaxID=27845 RepID=A0A8E0RTS5_9TREM|nr:hypothetical protein FBUS_02943 [Fasciolopsis buski]
MLKNQIELICLTVSFHCTRPYDPGMNSALYDGWLAVTSLIAKYFDGVRNLELPLLISTLLILLAILTNLGLSSLFDIMGRLS